MVAVPAPAPTFDNVALGALVKELGELVTAMKEARTPVYRTVSVSDTKPWISNYHNRKHLYLFSPSAFTLTVEDLASFPVSANALTLFPFDQGIRSISTTAATTYTFLVIATDELLPTGAGGGGGGSVTQGTSPWVVGGTVAVSNVNPNGPTTSPNSSPVVVATDQLPLAGSLTDAEPNPTVSQISAYNMGWNGTAWDRLKSDNTGAARASLYGKNVAAGDTPLLVDSAGRPLIGNIVQIGGVAPLLESQAGLVGAYITEDQIRNLIIAGKAYSVSTQKQTGFAGTGGFQFYNPASGTKNILILRVACGNAANVMFEMRKITTDQSALAGWTNQALTPSNLGASGTASTAVAGYSTTTVTGTFTGNYLHAETLNGNNEVEMLQNGACIWLPAGAGTLAGISLTWAETAVGFNINVFYLEF